MLKGKKSHHPPFEKAQNQCPKIKKSKPTKNQKNESVKTKKRTAKNHEINSEKTKKIEVTNFKFDVFLIAKPVFLTSIIYIYSIF